MKQSIFVIRSNIPAAAGVWRMELEGDVSAVTVPGQFVQLQLPGHYLRRPISVCLKGEGSLTLVYKAVGAGTGDMSQMLPGTRLDLLTGLGNGYDLEKIGAAPLVIGGGVGTPPLLWLCRALIQKGLTPKVLLGFNTASDVMLTEEFSALGITPIVATADGSAGEKGFVTDILPAKGSYDFYFACGPKPMLRAVSRAAAVPGQLSLEERMGCGFGACMGCTVMTRSGPRRVCKEGPVFESEDLIWDD